MPENDGHIRTNQQIERPAVNQNANGKTSRLGSGASPTSGGYRLVADNFCQILDRQRSHANNQSQGVAGYLPQPQPMHPH